MHSRRLENKITVGINLRLDADNPSDPGWTGGLLLRSWLLQSNLYTTSLVVAFLAPCIYTKASERRFFASLKSPVSRLRRMTLPATLALA